MKLALARSHKAKTDCKLSSLTMLPTLANHFSSRNGTSFGAHSHRKGNKQGIMHDCIPVQRLSLLVHGHTGSEVANVIQHGHSGSEVILVN